VYDIIVNLLQLIVYYSVGHNKRQACQVSFAYFKYKSWHTLGNVYDEWCASCFMSFKIVIT